MADNGTCRECWVCDVPVRKYGGVCRKCWDASRARRGLGVAEGCRHVTDSPWVNRCTSCGLSVGGRYVWDRMVREARTELDAYLETVGE